MFDTIFYLLVLSCMLLTGCSKKPTQVEKDNVYLSLLSDDEFGCDRERMHAREFSRIQNAKEQQKVIVSDFSTISCQDLIGVHEAKLVDIPIPLNAHSIDCADKSLSEKQKDLILFYTSCEPVDNLKDFYMLHMERLGWEQKGCFDSTELLLLFEKPARMCAISLRPTPKKFRKSGANQIVIFVSDVEQKDQSV